MKEGTSDPEFPKHFDGKRFYNPDAPQARGFLDVLRWKLTSRPEPSPRFMPDVEPSKPPPQVEGSGLRVTLVNHSTRAPPATAASNILTDPIWSERASPLVLGRSAPPQKSGSIVGGSAPHRPRADQPQSLRSSGSADAAPAGGSRRVPHSSFRPASPGCFAPRISGPSTSWIGANRCHSPGSPSTACRRFISQPGNFRPQPDSVVRVRDRMPRTAWYISPETRRSAVISPGFGKSSDRRTSRYCRSERTNRAGSCRRCIWLPMRR